MFYILKAVTQNVLHSQGSRTQQSTFSRQSHRTICILKEAAQNVPDSQDRRTKRSFYILKAVTQSVLLSQYSPTEPSIFTRQSNRAFYILNAVTLNVPFYIVNAAIQSMQCSHGSLTNFYILQTVVQNVLHSLRKFQILKAVAQNVLDFQCSGSERSRFSRHSLRMF